MIDALVALAVCGLPLLPLVGIPAVMRLRGWGDR
jgi:hypothetical protein